MSSKIARAKRKGRQFAALPFREMAGETRVVLVTSRESGRWILPKGWAEKGLTGAQLAAKEAYEEAGIRGRVAEKPIGTYHYLKKMPDGSELPCTVGVFPIEVESLEEKFREKGQRRRGWFNLAQAALQVEEEELVLLLLRLAAPDPRAPDAPVADRALPDATDSDLAPLPPAGRRKAKAKPAAKKRPMPAAKKKPRNKAAALSVPPAKKPPKKKPPKKRGANGAKKAAVKRRKPKSARARGR